ncbi:prolyl aminopeptidase Serine peptidase. MEROPS family S33 [Nitrosomonas cryotolerans]|uniref:Proline iminopeptidase n=1 Tax=Nitrosomonas cryotolerans ATCC 49181 TaxID=1131553 RepID=A0A1N6HMB3_9PROT|nr:prolyl aminopeptidase [Nitrosomonas cryotolerans]SFQ05581.1 prolyl aminopeptidase Serine peptidase. MEROPS family S33 [Nitrosomonas cryotolerans]SIO20910.1 prolyl aminopeptidase Serine peptidase. MEROPS family S33 [Nitrosomonas cryotolerans ATCC 49181]
MNNHFRTECFPAIEPYDSGMLSLDETHTMYWEQSGNAQGIPVVFLHGGPGAGASPSHRRFFDPDHYRIIIYDQRGAGRSTPLGEIHNNTTPHLINDLEVLRQYLNIEKWLVFGGSWGSTLALAYGETHPERCLGFILRGIFLCRKREIDWFLYGLRHFFPEAWREFVAPLSATEQEQLLYAYYQRLMHPDPAVHMPAARAWSRYEGACSTLLPNPEIMQHFSDDTVALGLARMEAHYFSHNIFLPENYLLEQVQTLHEIPATIVQGRYDAVCPIISADDLHQAWPQAEYIIVDQAGHSAWEPGIQAELIRATEKFKTRLSI